MAERYVRHLRMQPRLKPEAHAFRQRLEAWGVCHFLVVHPGYQNKGVGTLLNEFAVERMREAGMALALIRTGGDDAHAAARRSYEKAGFTALPQVMYLKSLL